MQLSQLCVSQHIRRHRMDMKVLQGMADQLGCGVYGVRPRAKAADIIESRQSSNPAREFFRVLNLLQGTLIPCKCQVVALVLHDAADIKTRAVFKIFRHWKGTPFLDFEYLRSHRRQLYDNGLCFLRNRTQIFVTHMVDNLAHLPLLYADYSGRTRTGLATNLS
jgi:hypothetical protein